eukprot:c8186_g1_i2.p1 GENE.c8186_g1_i2~~c8186_g1_i2.p1  ORF type:complete len:607 (+),score=214.44 c8186_g1_i2:37-1821(+)
MSKNAFKKRRLESESGDPEVEIVKVSVLGDSDIRKHFSVLAQMQQQKSLTDIKFIVKGQIFHAHKCVIACQSAPMRAMFENGMKETNKSEIELGETEASAFQVLIDYLYGRGVKISSGDVLSVLEIATKWEISALADICSTILMESVDKFNCWDVLSASDLFGCQPAKNKALSFIFIHFPELTKSQRFCSINVELVKEILSSDRLWRHNEGAIFDACVRWLQGNSKNMVYSNDVLQCIRFALIDPLRLVNEIKKHPVMESPVGKELYQSATDFLVLVMAKHAARKAIARKCSHVEMRQFSKHESDGIVYSLEVFENYLVAGFENGTLRVWDTHTSECLVEHNAHTRAKAIGSLAKVDKLPASGQRSSSDSPFCSSFLVTGFHDGSLKVWNMETWQCERTLIEHTQGVWSFVVLNNNYLISSSYDKTIKVWNTETWECEKTILAHKAEIECIATHDNHLFSASDDKTIKVWDLVTWECEYILNGHSDPVVVLKVTENYLLSASQDCTIRVWNLATMESEHILCGHDYCIRALAVMNGKLFSGGVDGKIMMWDMETWQPEKVIAEETDEIEQFNVIEGGVLVSGSAGGIIRKWYLD